MWIHYLIYTHRHIQADLLHYICTFLFIGRIIGIFRSAKYIRYSREGFWDPVIKIFLVLVVIFKKKVVACHKSIISYNPLELSVQIYIGWTFSTLLSHSFSSSLYKEALLVTLITWSTWCLATSMEISPRRSFSSAVLETSRQDHGAGRSWYELAGASRKQDGWSSGQTELRTDFPISGRSFIVS